MIQSFKYKLILTLFFLNAIIHYSISQERVRFNHLTIQDGLNQNKVLSILKDRKGFMWFGTGDGLNKYDGISFISYRNDIKNKNSISTNYVVSMAEDADGDLIVCGSDAGISVFYHDYEFFKQYIHNPKDKNSLPDPRITKVFIDSKNNIWLGSNNSGLLLFNKKESTFKKYTFPLFKDFNYLIKIQEHPNGHLIVLTESAGLLDFNPITETFTRIGDATNRFPANKQTIDKTIYCDKSGNIWLGIQESGLYKLTIEGKILSHYQHTASDPNTLSSNRVREIIEGESGIFWIATDGGGLVRFDTLQNKFTTFQNNIFDPHSLSSNQIYSLFYDNNGILWIGTYAGGVNIYDKISQKFKVYYPEPTKPNSLSHKQVLSFLQDRDGDMWIGSDGGGVNIYNPEKYGDSFITYKHNDNNNNSISSDVVKTIFEDNEGILWFGTYNGGLCRYDKKKGIFKSYVSQNTEDDPNGPINNHIWAVLEDSYQMFWIACLSTKLDRFDKKTGKFIRPYKNKFSPLCTYTIYEDNNRRLWFGTANDGLFLYQRENDTFIPYIHNPNDTNSISGNTIFCIYQDKKGRLWIGTSGGGLNLLNKDLKTFEHFKKNDGLPNDNICGILEDNEGNLWLSTYKGVSKFNPEKRTFRNYNVNDGLQSDEFNYTAYGSDKNGRLYFGGINGFNVFYPKDVKDNPYKPVCYITELQIFNKTVNVNDATGLLKKTISETEHITIPYYYSVFTFKFAGLNYSIPQKNQYAYYMEGFEKDWNYAGNKKEATYTNLDPGTYTFRVKASNGDGVWNEDGTQIKITISPPWWKTKLAYASFITIILALLGTIYYLRVGYLERQKAKLEKMVEKRTFELKLSNELIKETNKVLEAHQQEIEQKNKTLIEQAQQLNETNTLLEERQMRIEEQSEELYSQKEELETQRDTLAELNATKDKLFSVLAHDLRSPFNTIIGYSDLLYNKVETYPIEKIKNQIGYIRDGAKDTFGLLNNLLEWSRAQQGAISCELEELNLNECLNSELKILIQQAARKEIEIKTQEKGIEKPIIADINMLQTVIRNLISNAIKFSKTGSTIWIITEYLNDNVIFSVKDQGTGMPEDVMEKLFTISGNVSKRGTAGEKGTGLGLLLCADFISKQNGKIWVESKENEGSTFFFSIPAKQDKNQS